MKVLKLVWACIECPIWFVGSLALLSVLNVIANAIEAWSLAAKRYREITR